LYSVVLTESISSVALRLVELESLFYEISFESLLLSYGVRILFEGFFKILSMIVSAAAFFLFD
jgi:hypothetical protein